MSRDFVGGHELDAMPSKFLFNVVWGLSAVVLASLVTCVQIFNVQRDTLMSERGAEGSYVLHEYQTEMVKVTTEAGQTEIPKVAPDGTTSVEVLAYKPLAEARKAVLSDPNKLKAAPPPAGWVHPDDVAAGGAGAAGKTSAPAAVPGQAIKVVPSGTTLRPSAAPVPVPAPAKAPATAGH